MAVIPNLYLKWRAFHALTGHRKSDAMAVFNDHSGSFRFSKLLHGDIHCTPEIAGKVVRVINERLTEYRSSKGLPGNLSDPLRGSDLEGTVYMFVRRMLDVAEAVDDGELRNVHTALLDELTVQSNDPDQVLVVERYVPTRSFPPFKPSGPPERPVFEIGKDKGQLAVTGATAAPLAAYTLLARDPAPLGLRLWEMNWGETVLWLPSPFVPTRDGNRLLLMPDPQPVEPKPGRFVVTTALLWNEEAIGKLDPRGSRPSAGVLDEHETSRFLTNLRRVQEDKQKKWQGAVTVLSADYIVKA